MDFETDSNELIDIIAKHQYKDAIMSMFRKGPPPGEGFMWCDEEDTSYWSNNEIIGLMSVKSLVLSKNYESSGYGLMMRYLQKKVIENK
tara:strand:+ start:152 stop:418 length:267 start_codon:yes stop_codon:yes gene_type:complete